MGLLPWTSDPESLRSGGFRVEGPLLGQPVSTAGRGRGEGEPGGNGVGGVTVVVVVVVVVEDGG